MGEGRRSEESDTNMTFLDWADESKHRGRGSDVGGVGAGVLRTSTLDGAGLQDPMEHGGTDACWVVMCADLKLTESTGARNRF